MSDHVLMYLRIAIQYLYRAADYCRHSSEPWTREMDDAHRTLFNLLERMPDRTNLEAFRRSLLGIAPREERNGLPE